MTNKNILYPTPNQPYSLVDPIPNPADPTPLFFTISSLRSRELGKRNQLYDSDSTRSFQPHLETDFFYAW